MEKDLVADTDKNNRKFTKYVKSKTKSKTSIGPLVTKDKKILTGAKEMAEELNSFFATVFTQEDLSSIPEAETELIQKVMPPVQVTQQEIAKNIRKLRRRGSRPGQNRPQIYQRIRKSTDAAPRNTVQQVYPNW
jgi:hypothetical protein